MMEFTKEDLKAIERFTKHIREDIERKTLALHLRRAATNLYVVAASETDIVPRWEIKDDAYHLCELAEQIDPMYEDL